jgi:hypothetical protein
MAKMAELHLRIPEELSERLRKLGERRGESLRTTVVGMLWDEIGHAEMWEQVRPVMGRIRDLSGTEKGQKRDKFTPPTLAEVIGYCEERMSRVDARAFWNYYESNGWKVGKNGMKNWRSAVGTWERNESTGGNHGRGQGQGRRVSATEERANNIRRKLVDVFTNPAGDAVRPDGTKREGGPAKRITE